jgi:chromosome segregation ATPase
MGISKDSRQAIQKEIERLEGQKSIAIRRIKELADKKESLAKRNDSIATELQNLKKDVESGRLD